MDKYIPTIEVIRDSQGHIVDYKKIDSDGSDIYPVVPSNPNLNLSPPHYTHVQIANTPNGPMAIGAFEAFKVDPRDTKSLLLFLKALASNSK